jgi:hypothetical protein
MIAASGRKSSGAGIAAAFFLTILFLASGAAHAAPAGETKAPGGTPVTTRTPSATKPPATLRKRPAPASGDVGKLPSTTEKPKTPAAPPTEPRPEERKAPALPALRIPPFPDPPRNVLSTAPGIDTSKPPPLLPRAPRERMRACAEQWIDLKQKSRVGLPMWRDFAAKCLTR